MELLKQRILTDGVVLPGGILRVDSFLNHQMDIDLINEIGKEFKRIFGNEKVDKIFTIEASGIGIACIVAQYFKVPVVFAKKAKSKNLIGDVYSAEVKSFTKGNSNTIMVCKDYIKKGENILVIDDFLAKGNALIGLTNILKQAQANIVGCGICVEKAFQNGGETVRNMGIRVESLAKIKSMSDDSLVFED